MSFIMNHDVFISYSSIDEDKVMHLYERLSGDKHGIRCWNFKISNLPGYNYKDTIVDAISASSIVLFVQSANSIASQDVRNEINVAVSLQKKVIPFRIDRSVLSGSLLYDLVSIHAVDGFGKDFDACIDTLAGLIRKTMSAMGIAPARPVPELPHAAAAAVAPDPRPGYVDVFVNGVESAHNDETQQAVPAAVGDSPNDVVSRESDFTFVVRNGYACITAGPDRSVVVIPQTLGGVKVTSLAPGSFRNMRKLKRVVIPEGVVELGDGIFSMTGIFGGLGYLIPTLIAPPISPGGFLFSLLFRKLTAYWVTQRDRREINGVFAGCPLLEKVTLPSTLRFIGPHSFTMTSALEALTIPDGVQQIDQTAFTACCKKLTLLVGKDTDAHKAASRLRRGLDDDRAPFIEPLE